MDKTLIYLDNNSTTQVDKHVLASMLPYFSDKYGNPSNRGYSLGWVADEAIEIAKHQVATLINCESQEIVFTSGATESIQIGLVGIYRAYQSKGNEFITVRTEHNAVLDTLKYLETEGAKVNYLNVDKNGIIDINKIISLINDKTICICIMLANNETGVIQPIKEIANIAHQFKIIFFCDATQAIGKMPTDVQALGIDVLCMSAHKFYGPKGVGALFLRRKNPRVVLKSFANNTYDTKNLRSGTMNVPGIVGMGSAAEISYSTLNATRIHLLELQKQLEKALLNFGGKINGSNTIRIPNTINFTFDAITSQQFITKTKDFLASSTGSACNENLNKPSHVLKAMNLSEIAIKSTIRFSLGKYNTKEEIGFLIKKMNEIWS